MRRFDLTYLNQCTQQLDLHEAHLCTHEHICDYHEAEVRAARLSGMSRGSGSGSE
jgi:hypothetical protein